MAEHTFLSTQSTFELYTYLLISLLIKRAQNYYNISLLGQKLDQIQQSCFSQIQTNYLMSLLTLSQNQTNPQELSQKMIVLEKFILDSPDSQIKQIKPLIPKILCMIDFCIKAQNALLNKKAVMLLDVIIYWPDAFDSETIGSIIQLCKFQRDRYSKIMPIQEAPSQYLERATLLLAKQKQNFTKKYINEVVEFFHHKISQMDLKSIINCWDNLCSIQIHFQKWDLIFEYVFKLLLDCSHNTNLAFYTISSTIVCFKQDFCRFAKGTLQFILSYLRKTTNQTDHDTIVEAIDALGILICNARPLKNDPQWQIMVKQLFLFFFQSIFGAQRKLEYKLSESILNLIKCLIKQFGYLLNAKQLSDLFGKFLQIGKSIQSEKTFILKHMKLKKNTELIQNAHADLRSIYGCKFAQAQILYALHMQLKKSKFDQPSQRINVFIRLIQESNIVKPKQQDIDFAILLFQRLMQSFNFVEIKEQWYLFKSSLSQQYRNNSPVLKHLMSALKAAIECVPVQLVYQQLILMWVQSIRSTILHFKYVGLNSATDQKHYKASITCLGALLCKFNKKFDLRREYVLWFNHLPFKNHQQNTFQIKILCKILEQNPCLCLIFANDQESTTMLKRTFTLLAKYVYRQKQIANRIDQKKYVNGTIASILDNLMALKLFKQNQELIFDSLTAQQVDYFDELRYNWMVEKIDQLKMSQ